MSKEFFQTTVTFSLDTNAYNSGDLLADTQEIANAAAIAEDTVLESVLILDKDDQGVAMEMIFLDAATSLGTENSAPNISDANADAAIIGKLSIVSGDWIDIGGAKLAHKFNLNQFLKRRASVSSLYVGLISGGTPTHSAAGLVAKFTFSRGN